MTKSIFNLFIFIPVFLFSCNDDDKNDITTPSLEALEVTYKVTSSPSNMTEILISYNDSQGNYIVKTVESGWMYEARLPKGKKAFLSSAVKIKDEFIMDVEIQDCSTTAQIIQNAKIIKEAKGASVVVEIEP